MEARPPEEDWERQLRKWEAIWPLVARLLSFGGGFTIMFWQTVLENADRPYLIGAGITMMGLPVAGWLAESINKDRDKDDK